MSSPERAAAGGAPAAGRLCAEGLALHGRGEYAAAAERFLQALALDPSLAGAHRHLGRSLNNLGRLDEAGAAFAAALEADPGYARAHHNLGTVRNAQRRFEQAADCFRKGLAAEPGDVAGWTNLGDVLAVLERDAEAIDAYRRAIDADGGFADAHVGLGSILERRNLPVQAAAAYRDAVERAPGHAGALAGLAGIMELQGRAGEAFALVEPALAAQPENDTLVVAHARLLRRLGRQPEAIARLETLSAASGVSPRQRARMHFLLGDLLDEAGEYAAAFEHYRAAHATGRSQFDPVAFTSGVDSLIGYFSGDTLAALPRSGSTAEQPVFIVGMPRSGTSLVEQILAAHPGVHACGERTDLYALARNLSDRLASGLPYPHCLRDADAATLAALAGEYLAAAGAPATALRVTDKLPANFMNLGLIELLFPRARVIHCRRHPLDTALSCYFQHFASPGQDFTGRLEHIGVYMRLYRRIMAHWRTVTSLAVLDVDYEALVAEPETVTRRMLTFLGLDWEPACLRFHEGDRLVTTASYAQVREPVYSHSVGRHRHYAQYLAPFEQALGEEPAT